MKRAVLAHAATGARGRGARALTSAAAAIDLDAAPDLAGAPWWGWSGGRFETRDGATRLAPPRLDDATLYRARTVDGEWIASDLRALLAAGAAPRRIDRAGLAGLLWRGSPPGARPLLQGVEPVRATGDPPPAAAATLGDAARALRDALARGGATVVLFAGDRASVALARAARDAGLRATTVFVRRPSHDSATVAAARAAGKAAGLDLLVADAEPAGEAFERWRATALDAPSVDAFPTYLALGAVARAAPGAAVASPLAGAETFGDASWARRPRGLRALLARAALGRRLRPGGDPLDVAGQRERERAALARAPAAFVGAAASLLPAATRAAIAPAALRGSDGAAPASRGRARLADVAVLGACRDVGLSDLDAAARALGVRVSCPYLDEAFRSRVAALPDAVRFGREGSGGALGAWAGRGGGGAVDPAVLEREADAWLRGPLESVVDRDLAPDRVRDGGLLEPEAVARAIERWRAREAGWAARPVLLLALVSEWARRHELALAEAS